MQDEVLIAGFGRRGHAVGDIPGVRFKVSPTDDAHRLQFTTQDSTITILSVENAGREGVRCVPAGSVQGQEGEAPLLNKAATHCN